MRLDRALLCRFVLYVAVGVCVTIVLGDRQIDASIDLLQRLERSDSRIDWQGIYSIGRTTGRVMYCMIIVYLFYRGWRLKRGDRRLLAIVIGAGIFTLANVISVAQKISAAPDVARAYPASIDVLWVGATTMLLNAAIGVSILAAVLMVVTKRSGALRQSEVCRDSAANEGELA